MNELAAKSQEGTLAGDEQLEIESYRQACRLLDLDKGQGAPLSQELRTSPARTRVAGGSCDGSTSGSTIRLSWRPEGCWSPKVCFRPT